LNELAKEFALDQIRHAASTTAEALDLSGRGLRVLPTEIGQLPSLQTLNLAYNKLRILPAELGALSETVDLRLHGNPLAEPLPQLVERGTRELFAYLRSLQHARAQYEAKVVLVARAMSARPRWCRAPG
jgi:hypothetical protein